MTTDELRKTYLDFFKAKAHQVFSSDSLIPQGDPSLLFTGAGMNQFKPYFLGLKKDLKRAASCQKCLRTADLDRVGKTAYHHSFFEMLGNFSFGDYFKEEAIAWGWEFVTKALRFPKDKLWVSVYEEDEEAFLLWRTKIGLPESQIVRMDAKDNFWPSNAKIEGPNGPCGPCSEIYVGALPGKGVEIWNLVFTQFDRQSDGSLKNLPQKNIDTGMGLERTAAVLQNVESNFDIDTFKKIRADLKRLLKKDQSDTPHENAVMDHLRAVVFSIADGALPSNEGRGYVIRKVIRLGCDHLEKAGSLEPGQLHKLVSSVVEVMEPAYPELREREKMVTAVIQNEEKTYLEVLRTYGPRLDQEWGRLKSKSDSGQTQRAAEIAFKYYDTYGLPFETIDDSAKQAGFVIDKDKFAQLLDEQKERSRQSSKLSAEIFSGQGVYSLIEGLRPTRFLGYEKASSEAKIVRILRDGRPTTELVAGEEGVLICDQTPFYAEAGGQVGDTGKVSATHFKADVVDTHWIEKCIGHKVQMREGRATPGDSCKLEIDSERRAAIMKNHTATHLLHSALRRVLGEHVKQSGSLVAPDRLRFDFTHFSALSPEELAKIEALVNTQVQQDTKLLKQEMSKNDAVQKGAIAFFGEKYGDEVRVVSVGEFSKELCGGTHLESTGEIKLFKIISEGSIQAGVRRIEAVTGRTALTLVESSSHELENIIQEFHLDKDHALDGLKNIEGQVSTLKSRANTVMIEKMRQHLSALSDQSPEIHGSRLLVAEMKGANPDLVKEGVDYLRSRKGSFAAFISSDFGDKISFVVASSPDLAAKGFHSGKIVKEVSSMVDGNGGAAGEILLHLAYSRPANDDFAQAIPLSGMPSPRDSD